MPGASWLHIRNNWVPLNGVAGRATLMHFRYDRLPWYHEHYLLAAVLETDLLLLKTKLTSLREISEIWLSDTIIRLSPADLSTIRLDEYAPWPAAEAIYEGYSLTDVMTSYRPQHQLTDALLKSINQKPVKGWQPVHRGALGLSLLHDCANGLGCLELTADVLKYRTGLVAENEALLDRNVVRRWDIHNFDVASIARRTGSTDDAMQARLMARRMRSDAWDWIVHNELPF